MSSRPLLKPYTYPSVSMAATSVTPATNTFQLNLLSYTAAWTGTPTGTFTVEACNDAQFDPNGAYIANTGSWDTIVLSTTPAATGAAGSALVSIAQLSFAFVRLRYTASSGTGSLTVTVAGKV